MYESYKSFSLEDKQWNQSFYDATKNRDKKKVFELLSKAGNVYLDEYSIDHSIFELNNAKLSNEKREKLLESIKNNKIVEDIVEKNDTISIKTASNTIKVSKWSDIIPGIQNVIPSNKESNLVNRSCFRSEYISQMLTFPNSVVTGYTYGIADKARSLNTWVEFKNNNNQEFVVFPDSNTVYNKEGFYFLKHAEPLKKVSSDDLKGKTSVGKSSGSYTELGANNEIVDVEIDLGDER